MTKIVKQHESNDLDCRIRTRLRGRGFKYAAELIELRRAIADVIGDLAREKPGDTIDPAADCADCRLLPTQGGSRRRTPETG